MNIEANLRWYLYGSSEPPERNPDARYASFDYCFNYFQSFRDARDIAGIASPVNLQLSCLQLGFYLASWGMLRGSAELHQRSMRNLVPVVQLIAATDPYVWEIDADCYTEPNLDLLLDLAGQLQSRELWSTDRRISDILVTKVMLGVFGSVPAFDTVFRRGAGVSSLTREALSRLGDFYLENAEVLDRYRVPTLDFISGRPAKRLSTRAKVLDMLFFTEGWRLNSWGQNLAVMSEE